MQGFLGALVLSSVLSTEARSPTRITAWVFTGDQSSAKQSGADVPTLLQEAEKEVRDNKHYQWTDLTDAANLKESEVRDHHFEVAERVSSEGRKSFDELDTAISLQKFEQALAEYAQTDLSKHFPLMVKAWTMKIASLIANGSTKATDTEWRKLLAVEPKLSLSPNDFSPDTLALVEKRKKLNLKEPTPELGVASSSPDSQVYIDGVFRGMAPVKFKVTAGDHFLTLVTPGYALLQQTVHFGSIKVEPVQQPAAEALKELSGAMSDSKNPQVWKKALISLVNRLGLDGLLVLVPDVEGNVRIDRVYRFSEGGNLATVKSGNDVSRSIKDALDDRPDGLLLGSTDRMNHPSKRSSTTPGYVLLGSGAGAIALGVVFGVLSANHNSQFAKLAQTDPRAGSLKSSGRTLAIAADVSYLVGLIAAGIGVYQVAVPGHAQ